MDLWIRSQDKSALVNVKSVLILNNEIRGYYNENPNWFLGKYETEERALGVLDEIQEAQLGNYHYRCPSNVKVSNNENTIVYEMPKE